MKFKVFHFVVVVFGLSFAIFGQEKQNEQAKDPVLVELTETEKKIDPRTVVANQPDFIAVESYFSARQISGFSAASKVARLGKQYRTDTGFVVVISEAKKPTLRLFQDRTIEESIGDRKPFVSATSPLNPTDLLEFEDISFASLGTIDLDGNKLLKIQAKSKAFTQDVFLYADLGRRNLISIVQIQSPQRNSIQRLQEISFDVPKVLFDLTGYNTRPKFLWNRVLTAKVVHKGKAISDALVFRHKDYVFVHVAEFEHFFIDLKKNIAATVVFQGLLVAKDGNYVWRTKYDEATSVGDLEGIIEPKGEYRVKISSTSNSFSIPDSKNKSKPLLQVEWE